MENEITVAELSEKLNLHPDTILLHLKQINAVPVRVYRGKYFYNFIVHNRLLRHYGRSLADLSSLSKDKMYSSKEVSEILNLSAKAIYHRCMLVGLQPTKYSGQRQNFYDYYQIEMINDYKKHIESDDKFITIESKMNYLTEL